MRRCIELAERAHASGDTPVGSIVVRDGRLIAEGIEAVQSRLDPAAHAEAEAVRQAVQALGTLSLIGCTLYTTAEPCFLCSYAIRATGISTVVVGTPVPHIGGITSRHQILTDDGIPAWACPPEVILGVLRDECATLRATSREE